MITMSLALQQGFGNKQASSLAVTILVHAALGAALLTGLRIPLPPPTTPAVTLIPPTIKPQPVEPPLVSGRVEMRDVVFLPPPIDDVVIETARDADVVLASPRDVSRESGTATADAVDSKTRPSVISRDVGIACSNAREVQANLAYPAAARRSGLEGDVVARFVLSATGVIRDIAIVSSSSTLLNRTVLNAIPQFRCEGQGRDVVLEAPFSFRLRD